MNGYRTFIAHRGEREVSEEEWPSLDEIRFLLIRAMLEEYPELRQRVIEHIRKLYPMEMWEDT